MNQPLIPTKILEHFGGAPVKETLPLGGSALNDLHEVFLADGQHLFLKSNQREALEGMMDGESRGLNLLQQAGAHVPVDRVVWEDEFRQYLICSFLKPVRPNETQWEKAGSMLANVHRTIGDAFGLDHANYMGKLPQMNESCREFADFFFTMRLEPWIKWGLDAGMLTRSDLHAFETLVSRFGELIPAEPPRLVHGDLWSGNLHFSGPLPYLIDPAVAFSHREVDLAMTHLFGGFEEPFYRMYSESFPLEPGFSARIGLYNLYPLLVHLRLFGYSYHAEIKSILNPFRR